MEQVCKRKRDRSNAEIELKYKQNKRILNEGLQSLSLNHYTSITDVADGDVYEKPTETGNNGRVDEDVQRIDSLDSTDDEVQVHPEPLPPEEEHLISVLKGGQVKYLRKVDFLVDELIRKTHRTEMSRQSCPQEFDSQIPSHVGPSPTTDHAISQLWPVKIFDPTHYIDGGRIDVHPGKIANRWRGGSDAVYVSSSGEDEEEEEEEEEDGEMAMSGDESDVEDVVMDSGSGRCGRKSRNSSRIHCADADGDGDDNDDEMNGPTSGSGYLADGERTGIPVSAAGERKKTPNAKAGDTTHSDWGIVEVRPGEAVSSSSSPRDGSRLGANSPEDCDSYISAPLSTAAVAEHNDKHSNSSQQQQGQGQFARYRSQQHHHHHHHQQSGLLSSCSHGQPRESSNNMQPDDGDEDEVDEEEEDDVLVSTCNNGSSNSSHADGDSIYGGSTHSNLSTASAASAPRVPYYIDAQDNVYFMLDSNLHSSTPVVSRDAVAAATLGVGVGASSGAGLGVGAGRGNASSWNNSVFAQSSTNDNNGGGGDNGGVFGSSRQRGLFQSPTAQQQAHQQGFSFDHDHMHNQQQQQHQQQQHLQGDHYHHCHNSSSGYNHTNSNAFSNSNAATAAASPFS